MPLVPRSKAARSPLPLLPRASGPRQPLQSHPGRGCAVPNRGCTGTRAIASSRSPKLRRSERGLGPTGLPGTGCGAPSPPSGLRAGFPSRSSHLRCRPGTPPRRRSRFQSPSRSPGCHRRSALPSCSPAACPVRPRPSRYGPAPPGTTPTPTGRVRQVPPVPGWERRPPPHPQGHPSPE